MHIYSLRFILINSRYRAEVALYFFILIAVAAPAQTPVFRNYTTRDRLPSNEVYCAFRDSKGFMWFGTDGGVCRFDGYEFHNYTTTDGLVDNTVFGMQEDKHGRIWFRSLSGRLCYWHQDSIFSIGANDSIAALFGNSLMISMYIDSGDTIWCGLRAGLGYFKIAPGYTKKEFRCLRLPEISPYIIKIEKGGVIWGNIFREGKPSFSTRVYEKNRLPGRLLKNELKYTNLYVCPLDDSRMLVSDDRLFAVLGDNGEKVFPSPAGTGPRRISFVKRCRSELWMGMFGSGAMRLRLSPDSLYGVSPRVLNGLTVTDVTADNEGGTWFTTLEEGIFYSSPDHFNFNSFAPNQLFPDNLLKLTNFGSCLGISVSGSKLNILYTDSMERSMDARSPGMVDFLERAGLTAPLTIPLGVGYIKGQFSTFVWYPAEKVLEELRDSTGKDVGPYCTAIDKRTGCVYITDRFSLFIKKGPDHPLEFAGLLPSRTFSVFLDEGGVLWLGTISGLWSFEKGKFISHADDNPFFSVRINDLTRGPGGGWVMATAGSGIILETNGLYRQLTVKDGLPSDNCECLFIDSYHTIWVGTKNGLCNIHLGPGGRWQATRFDVGSDLLSQKVMQIEQCGHTLWVRIEKGLVSHQLPLLPDTVPVQVRFNRFEVNGEPQPTNIHAELTSVQSDIRIDYLGLSYRDFGKVMYEYKLEGLDTSWHTVSATSIHYPFLPPGRYSFLVRTARPGGSFSAPAVLSFTIRAPWWKSWWFFLSIAAAGAGVLLVVVSARIRTIRKKEMEKTALNARIADIEMKALRAQMNPHFIFNAINSIQNHIIKNDRRTAQDYLAKFARLIRNVLENSKSEYIPLIQEIETLGLYVELEQLRNPGRFSYELKVDPSLEVYDTFIPPLLLQPFVENAIQHGILPLAGDNGHVAINIDRSNGTLVCTIDDNGIGREKAAERKKNLAFTYRSLGLSVTEERIHIINSFRKGLARLDFEDKRDSDGRSLGTRVILVVPYLTQTTIKKIPVS
jgi:hypothetical protein